MRTRRILCFFFSVALLVLLTCSIFSAGYDDGLYSGNACVFNVEYHKMVYGKKENEKVSPGQTAKIMTAIIALEHYGTNMNELVEVSSEALKGIYRTTVLDLKAEEKIPAKDLIYSMLISGANDSSNALAIAISGSIASFAEKMNAKASEIGAVNTHFTCPTGLDGKNAYTTAYDIALISAYAYSMDGFMDICNTRAYTTSKTNSSDERRVFTRNYLISSGTTAKYFNTDASGILIGYTEDSNWCLVTSPKTGSFQYIIVCMNCVDADSINVYYDGSALIKWCKNAYSVFKVIDSSEILGTLPVALSSVRDWVSVSCENDYYSFLPVDYTKDKIRTVIIPQSDKLTAPVVKGQVVGEVEIYYEDQYLGKTNLISNIDAPLSASKEFWISVRDTITSKTAIIVLALIVTAALAVFVIRYIIVMKKAGKTKSDK